MIRRYSEMANSLLSLYLIVSIEVCTGFLITQKTQEINTDVYHPLEKALTQVYYVDHPCGDHSDVTCEITRIRQKPSQRSTGWETMASGTNSRFYVDSNNRLYSRKEFEMNDIGALFDIEINCQEVLETSRREHQVATVLLHVTRDSHLLENADHGCFPTNQLAFDVYENVAGHTLGTIYPYTWENSRYRYVLEANQMTVDAKSGDLILGKPLDREQMSTESFIYSLKCKPDCSHTSYNEQRRCRTDETLETKTVTLKVHDVNDNGPKIKRLGKEDGISQINPPETLSLTDLVAGTRVGNVIFFDADDKLTNQFTTSVDDSRFELSDLNSFRSGITFYYQAALLVREDISDSTPVIRVNVKVTDESTCNTASNNEVTFRFTFNVDKKNMEDNGMGISLPPVLPVTTKMPPSPAGAPVDKPRLVLTQTSFSKVIAVDHDINVPLVNLYHMQRPCVKLAQPLQCIIAYVTTTSRDSGFKTAVTNMFVINDESYAVYLRQELLNTAARCNISVDIHCTEQGTEDRHQIDVLIQVVEASHTDQTQLCPRLQRDMEFTVFENVAGLVIGDVSPSTSSVNSGLSYKIYYPDKPEYNINKPVTIEGNRGLLFLEITVDREIEEIMRIIIECDDKFGKINSSVSLRILDIDDNAPYVEDGSSGIRQTEQRIDIELQHIENRGHSIVFKDDDTAGVNRVLTLLMGDGARFFVVTPLKVLSYGRSFFHTKLQIKEEARIPIGTSRMNVTVRFTDTSICPSGANAYMDFYYHIVVDPSMPSTTEAPTINAVGRNSYGRRINVQSTSAPFTRVFKVTDDDELKHLCNFNVGQDSLDGNFNITKNTGIIYVANNSNLRSSGRTGEGHMFISARDCRDQSDANLVITVHLDRGLGDKDASSCDTSCSFVNTQEECTKRCGMGTERGLCEWRSAPNALEKSRPSSLYETCTPSITHCPNRECDELEDIEPWLCPQDCTRSVKGVYIPSRHQGIAGGQSPCWCNRDSECTCVSQTPLIIPNTDRGDQTNKINDASHSGVPEDSVNDPGHINSTHVKNSRDKSDFVPSIDKQVESDDFCNYDCKLAIVGAGIGILFMLVFGLFFCKLNVKRKRSIKLKHIVGSVVSLNNVTTENHDENENETDANDLRYALTGMTFNLKPDPKWEFPRQSLVLDKVIGEGEFGKVVRAQAINMKGKKGVTTVAVKMLRECASQSELRDLLSEYNLLKEVCHKNVIRLLGACTTADQFMLIVEYCSNGSLKAYLQNCRCHGEVTETGCIIYKIQNESGTLENMDDSSSVTYQTPLVGGTRHHMENMEYMIGPQKGEIPSGVSTVSTNKISSRNENSINASELSESSGAEDVIDILTVKDLMSLAWQVANGMQYLCDMKLVHRDLAARNVLVTHDKVAKISDFGLSRDIYTEDHYMKRSKGRVPVKWMAPESLYHHVYTTKSDVWSYGVLLWEITTMGATPYPGLQPESLFNLLKHGYRMTKPQGCSDHVYEVMKKCWHPEPTCRPNFKELSNIFEKVLKDCSGYLDLSSVYDDTLPFQDSSTPGATTEDEDAEYGSINVLSTDDNAYVMSPGSPKTTSAFHPNIQVPQHALNPEAQKHASSTHSGLHNKPGDTRDEDERYSAGTECNVDQRGLNDNVHFPIDCNNKSHSIWLNEEDESRNNSVYVGDNGRKHRSGSAYAKESLSPLDTQQPLLSDNKEVVGVNKVVANEKKALIYAELAMCDDSNETEI